MLLASLATLLQFAQQSITKSINVLLFLLSSGKFLLPTHFTYRTGGLNTQKIQSNRWTFKTTTKENLNPKVEPNTEKHTGNPKLLNPVLPPKHLPPKVLAADHDPDSVQIGGDKNQQSPKTKKEANLTATQAEGGGKSTRAEAYTRSDTAEKHG